MYTNTSLRLKYSFFFINTPHVFNSPHHLARHRVRHPLLPPLPNALTHAPSASRGIGFEIVRQLLESPSNLVVAACRTPNKATALSALKESAKGTLHIVQLDTSDFDSVRALPAQLEPILGSIGLDYLINNAGIVRPSPPSPLPLPFSPHSSLLSASANRAPQSVHDTAFAFDPESMLTVFRTNAIGPALVSQVTLPFLEKGSAKKILHVSSTLGSVGSADEFGARGASYSMSKSALNMLVRPNSLVVRVRGGS